MRAHARLGVTAETPPHTRIRRLRSDPPMLLRPAVATASDPCHGWDLSNAARVSLASSAAGPVGGDDLRLDIDVGADAVLVLRTVAATLALPGPHRLPSYTHTHIRVAERGTLLWLPEPVIAAHGCDHHVTTRIELASDARLLAREEVILGRDREASGTIRQRLRITQDHTPLHDQNLALGTTTPGWDGPAVTGGRKSLGSMIIVDPGLGDCIDNRNPTQVGTDVAVLGLSPSAAMITALADETLTLRRRFADHAHALWPAQSLGALFPR